MTRLVAGMIVALLGATVGTARAADHGNLDEGRPVRLEDAYAIGHGEVAIEAGAGLTLARRGPHRGVFTGEVLYGALPNLQLGLGSFVSTDPHAIDDRPKSGDLRASALYNFNQETLRLPALAAKLGVTAPTGVDARGYGVELKGIVTKSIGRLGVHLNAGYELVTDTSRDDRDGRYELVLGSSYPIAAPRFTRATLVADVFAEQPLRRHEATIVGAELGLRYQLTPRIVWDVGFGTELAGPADRSTFSMTTGLSFGF